MSKNDIRLRRQRFARGADRFRNYGAVMERHEKEKKLKTVLRVFSMFLVALIVVMLIVILSRVEKKRAVEKKTISSIISIPMRDQLVTIGFHSHPLNRTDHGNQKVSCS